MDMQRDEILKGIVDLAEIIEHVSGKKEYLCIAGSSALMLTCGLSEDRVTHDIDVIRCSDGVAATMQLLQQYDFNDASNTFDIEANYLRTQELECGFPMLDVEALSPESVVIMKLMSARKIDLKDIPDAIDHGINCQAVTDIINNFDFDATVSKEVADAARAHWQQFCPKRYATPQHDFFDLYQPLDTGEEGAYDDSKDDADMDFNWY